MRKICIMTGSRAEYGLLYWLIKEVDADPDLQLQIIATGMHLSPEFGLTYRQIEADGFTIDAKVEMLPSPYEFPESDKVVHVLAYAPLGFLLVYALSRSTSSSNLIFFGVFLAFLYGLTDEIHQAFVPGRDASALDVMADGTGAMIGSFIYKGLPRLL